MRRIRRTRTSVETRESIVVRTAAEGHDIPCPQCGGNSRMVSSEEAARFFGISVRDIFRRVEAGTVHFTELPGDGLLVCLNSIANP
jgi:hypothetical protein